MKEQKCLGVVVRGDEGIERRPSARLVIVLIAYVTEIGRGPTTPHLLQTMFSAASIPPFRKKEGRVALGASLMAG